MGNIYAGYDCLSRNGDVKNDTFYTFGLCNCIAIFAQKEKTAALAHYDTMGAWDANGGKDPYNGLKFLETNLTNFKNWMQKKTGLTTPKFTIVLGQVWHNTPDWSLQKIGGISYPNSVDFSRHNLILVLLRVFGVEPIAASPDKSVAFTPGGGVFTDVASDEPDPAQWRDKGTPIPYHDLR